MIRKCSTCKQTKNIEQFDFRSRSEGTRQYSCKDCSNKRSKQHYYDNKEVYLERRKRKKALTRKWILDYLKQNSCVDCGEDHPACLDFDHIRDKQFEIGRATSAGYSLKRIQEEIQKCVVRCSNCHRKKTAKDFGWYQAAEALK